MHDRLPESSAPELQRRLERVLAPAIEKHVAVALYDGSDRHFAGVSTLATGNADARTWEFPVGCLAKLLTGALIEKEIGAGRLLIDQSVGDLFDRAVCREAFEGITIRQLLEHTHGIDDAAVAGLPRRRDGLVDIEPLASALSESRLALPGEVHSYSSAGAWILAAILERLHEKPYGEQLESCLRDHFGIPVRRQANVDYWMPADICPAIGGPLAMTVEDLVHFLVGGVLRPSDRNLALLELMRGEVTPFPGWNAVEKGICRGWKYHGGTWFGHSSTWPRASLMVRLEPHRPSVIVVASSVQPAPIIAAKVLGARLPEYADLSIPRLLPADVAEGLDRGRYEGSYKSAAQEIFIEEAPDAEMRLRAGSWCSGLKPAVDEIFYLDRREEGRPTFIQFFRLHGGRFEFMWDGRRVYPRATRSWRHKH